MKQLETSNVKLETQNERLTAHFALMEFTKSATARSHGIKNEPAAEHVENLRALCVHTLEPLREALGLPVVITSGFRTKTLNNMLAHSSDRSQHMAGQAADFYVGHTESTESTESTEKASRRELLINAFRAIITSEQIDYDQLILYPSFIHVSYHSKERNRHTIMRARSDGKLGYGKLSVANALNIV